MVWPFKWNLFSSSFTWNHLSFSLVQKKVWKFFLVVFSSWSLLKSGRASLRVQHISKLRKNAIIWPGYFTLCCSPQTNLKMNSFWVHLLKFWFFWQPPATAPPPSSQTDSVAVKQEKTVSFKAKFAPFIFRHYLGWMRCDGITFQKLWIAMLIKIRFAFRWWRVTRNRERSGKKRSFFLLTFFSAVPLSKVKTPAKGYHCRDLSGLTKTYVFVYCLGWKRGYSSVRANMLYLDC